LIAAERNKEKIMKLLNILLLFGLTCGVYAQDSIKQQALSETFISYISKQDSLNSLKDLRSGIEEILNDDRLSKTKYGVSIYSLDREEIIYESNEDVPYTPASLTKLFTTFSAFVNYGKEYVFKTNLYVDSVDSATKEVYGNLYIMGTGDCAFSYNDLDSLFLYLKTNDISVLNGNINIDLSKFDKETSRFKYSGDDDRVQNVNPVTPFCISTKSGTKLKNYIKKFFRKNKISFRGNIKFTYNDINYSELNLIGSKERHILDLVYTTNKRSNNFFAEHLFKLNSLIHREEQSDFRNNQKRLYEIIDSLDINFDNCKINDGSGLSRRNKLTTKAIISLLRTAYKMDFIGEFRESLSEAGEDGTLKSRLIGTHGEHNINGKTGTLNNVSGLAGYLKTVDGENIAFAFIFNGKKRKTFKYIENELADLISGFFYFNEKYE